jgi:hypothetical protein
VSEIPLRFDEHLYDAVMEAFSPLERMVVVGERIDSEYHALNIRLAVDVGVEWAASESPASEKTDVVVLTRENRTSNGGTIIRSDHIEDLGPRLGWNTCEIPARIGMPAARIIRGKG